MKWDQFKKLKKEGLIRDGMFFMNAIVDICVGRKEAKKEEYHWKYERGSEIGCRRKLFNEFFMFVCVATADLKMPINIET